MIMMGATIKENCHEDKSSSSSLWAMITCDIYSIKMIFDAYLSINDFIFMHVIILICIFLLLYEKLLYSQKYFK